MAEVERESDEPSWRDRCLSLQGDFGWLLASIEGVKPAPVVDQALVRALDECWIRPDSLVLPVARYLAAKWPRALSGQPAPNEPQLFEVVRDPVLLAMLRSTPTATPGLDILLARVRLGALKAVMAHQDIDAFIPTLVALAVRGWHSGYALTLPLEPRHEQDRIQEPTLVPELGRQLEQGDREGRDLVAALAVYSAYAPPEAKHLQAALATGDPAVRFIEENVAAPRLRQREIAQSLVPLTRIGESNADVAEQYEAHPYPAWAGEPMDSVDLPQPIIDALPPGGPQAVESVLVAGCGTGQHAMVAARAWPNADILAIDISRTSLAYAIDQTRPEIAGRIRFELADLLEIGQLGRRFQVIESMGVLHHLADPEAGLHALTAVLEPGGIIGIGLYSKAARIPLAEVRDRYGPADMESDEAVRNFRAWALAELRGSKLLYSPDFYSIGGCRDAFFHVREHCYSLEQIGEMLDRAGLRLLAVQTPRSARQRLSTLPEPADLAGWSAAEREHGDLFLGMYAVWAQAPGGQA